MSGFTPVGNVRDMIADVIQGDWLDAGINAVGLVFDGADVTKTAGKIGKFLINNSDNIGLYAEILTFINKNFPDAVKYLGKSDDFVLATKEVVKASNGKLTKKQYEEILSALTEAGLEKLLENSFESGSGSKTFYTVQGIDDVKRLLNGGEPWPEKSYRAHLGVGVYAFDKLSVAQDYMKRRSRNFNDLQILEFSINNIDFEKINKLDMTLLTDEEATEFLQKYSSLYGEGLKHDYDFIKRGAGMENEYYFSSNIFELLHFKQ